MQTLQKKNSQIQNKFETAVQHLQKYHQGNSLFDTRFPKYAVGQKFITPFQQLRIQNSSFCDCTFHTTRMSVPETSMNENYSFVSWQNYIRFS